MREIPPGAVCLSPKSVQRKFDKGHDWFWSKVKEDPTFPKLIYLGGKSPVQIEQELDAWLAAQPALPGKSTADRPTIASHANQRRRIAARADAERQAAKSRRP